MAEMLLIANSGKNQAGDSEGLAELLVNNSL
jgi:hypothetical protein